MLSKSIYLKWVQSKNALAMCRSNIPLENSPISESCHEAAMEYSLKTLMRIKIEWMTIIALTYKTKSYQ